MGDKKTIQVNPNFLSGKKSTKTEKKRKETLQSLIKPNSIKKSLINKIKSFHKNVRNKNNNLIKNERQDKNEQQDNKDGFKNNINYLDNIIKSRKEKKRLKKERKKQRTLKKELDKQLSSQGNIEQYNISPMTNLNQSTSN